MNNCGKCVDFLYKFYGLGLCYGGRKYQESIDKKGRAPVRCILSPGCADFCDCQDFGFPPVDLKALVKGKLKCP